MGNEDAPSSSKVEAPRGRNRRSLRTKWTCLVVAFLFGRFTLLNLLSSLRGASTTAFSVQDDLLWSFLPISDVPITTNGSDVQATSTPRSFSSPSLPSQGANFTTTTSTQQSDTSNRNSQSDSGLWTEGIFLSDLERNRIKTETALTESIPAKQDVPNSAGSTPMQQFDGKDQQLPQQPPDMPQSKPATAHRIFFNIYMGTNVVNDTNRLIRATLLQLEHIFEWVENPQIGYVLIGAGNISSVRDLVETKCKGYCNLLTYREEAQEDATLSELHTYCHQNPSHTVSYLHNEGSYRPSPYDSYTYLVATGAALSKECRAMSTKNCNLCGARTQSTLNTPFLGNMWSASCTYITQLYPPTVYQKKRAALCQNYSFSIDGEGDVSCPYSNSTLTATDHLRQYGYGRFAFERWVLTHPSQEPCGVLNIPPRKCLSQERCPWTPTLSEQNFTSSAMSPEDRLTVKHKLLEFEYLYGSALDYCERQFARVIPSPCDLNADLISGSDHMAFTRRSHVSGSVSPKESSRDGPDVSQESLSEEAADVTTWSKVLMVDTPNEPSPTKHAIFYNVYMGQNVDGNDTLKAAIVEEQIGQVYSHRKSPIYYNLIGAPNVTHARMIVEKRCLDCRFMQHFKEAQEQVTLEELHGFCLKNPQYMVSYLHNKGSFTSKIQNEKIRRVGTKAAVSDACLNMNSKNCNVCGARVYDRPVHHVTANMWTASCEYVSKLLSPRLYQKKRREICADYNFSIPDEGDANCPFATDLPMYENNHSQQYGFGRYAYERWILSHYDVQPCQVFLVSLNRCTVLKCNWEPDLAQARWFKKKLHAVDWYRLRHKLLEFDYLYGRQGDYCNRHFSNVWPSPCDLQYFNRSSLRFRPKEGYAFPKWE